MDVARSVNSVDHSLVAEQDSRAAQTANLVLAILCQRSAIMFWHDAGYPGALALFASEDDDTLKLGWAKLEECAASFAEVQEGGSTTPGSRSWQLGLPSTQCSSKRYGTWRSSHRD